MSSIQKPKSSSHTERLEAMQKIAVQLINSREPHDLLHLIVNKAMDLLYCDAGSLYLKKNEKDMVFEVAVNRSLEFKFEKQVVSILGNGIATYCYRSAKPIIVHDVYKIPPQVPYTFDNSFDIHSGYRTRSVIAHPLISSKGETLGVLQLINRKHEATEEWPSKDEKQIENMPTFTEEDNDFLVSFAALASAAIENSKLYQNIENLFEGFVKASVDAIETRDPATRGHSERVAYLTLDLAQRVSDSNDPEFKQYHFSDRQMLELRYATLLHDFGKIGVREETLLKEKKLFDIQKIAIESRLKEFLHAREIELLRELISMAVGQKQALSKIEATRVEKVIKSFQTELMNHWDKVLELNEPTVLNEDKDKTLQKLKKLQFKDTAGQIRALLNENEVELLSIKKGSLSPIERLEIEMHATNSYHFLRQIPWTSDLANIPEIAYAHHEKMNGLGYPRKISGEQIPIQTRMMSICDIYDALVANDRPYKKALPREKALQIIGFETKDGALDAKFVKMFIESKVYENPDFNALISGNKNRAA